jgi:hypothetical protein
MRVMSVPAVVEVADEVEGADDDVVSVAAEEAAAEVAGLLGPPSDVVDEHAERARTAAEPAKTAFVHVDSGIERVLLGEIDASEIWMVVLRSVVIGWERRQSMTTGLTTLWSRSSGQWSSERGAIRTDADFGPGPVITGTAELPGYFFS